MDVAKTELFKRAYELWNAEYDSPNERVPDLYHYTTVEGLNGILLSCSIFASHIRYLNDASEVEHALSFARGVLEKLPPEGALGVGGERLRNYGSFFFGNADFLWEEDAYVTSFCEEGDLLSQWRSYAMGGFAILFAAPVEENFLKNESIWRTTIQKVIYKDEDKRDALLKILAAGVKAHDKGDGDKGIRNKLSALTSMELQTWVNVAKHDSFEQEREWRIISFMGPQSEPLKARDGFQTRVVSGQLVPCVPLKPTAGRLLPILGVKCGPNQGQGLTEKAVKLLLSSHGYPTDRLSTSMIPFRSRY